MRLSYYNFKLIIYATVTRYQAGYITKHSVFSFWQDQDIFLFFTNFTLTLETKQLPTYWVQRGNFSGDTVALA
jgi:hypothetical protein